MIRFMWAGVNIYKLMLPKKSEDIGRICWVLNMVNYGENNPRYFVVKGLVFKRMTISNEKEANHLQLNKKHVVLRFLNSKTEGRRKWRLFNFFTSEIV